MFPNIDAECARKKITLYKLAEMLNVNRKTLGKWLAKGSIPANKLLEMSEIFNKSIDYLLGRSDA